MKDDTFFEITMFIKNKEGGSDRSASYKGNNSFEGIRKLLDYYEQVYTIMETDKELSSQKESNL